MHDALLSCNRADLSSIWTYNGGLSEFFRGPAPRDNAMGMARLQHVLKKIAGPCHAIAKPNRPPQRPMDNHPNLLK